jgi:hypothetical protein
LDWKIDLEVLDFCLILNPISLLLSTIFFLSLFYLIIYRALLLNLFQGSNNFLLIFIRFKPDLQGNYLSPEINRAIYVNIIQ